jgi:2'-5' RNA ligase
MPDTDLRLFLAVMPAPQTIRKLALLAEHESALRGGYPVALAAMHLTLYFLGSVAIEDVTTVGTIAAEAASNARCESDFDRLSVMGRSLLVLGTVSPSPQLLSLQSSLQSGLIAAGFRQETRRYRPHLTLIRHLPPAHATAERIAPIRFCIDHIALIRSRLTPHGSQYEELGRWGLQTEPGRFT